MVGKWSQLVKVCSGIESFGTLKPISGRDGWMGWLYRTLRLLRAPYCANNNKTITDGGVAPPTILLTIVMMSSNLKSLRISRNSKYSSRIVGSAQSAFAPAALRSSFAPAALRLAYTPAALRLILIIDL